MAHHVLIADPDPATGRLVALALRRVGYQVSVAKTGARALELCILSAPALVLFDLACPLIDARTFRQILRANPHTEQIPVLLTGAAPEGEGQKTLEDGATAPRGFLQKPYGLDELLLRIDQAFQRLETMRKGRRGDQGMEGTLGPVSLIDLLQILGQNRRSGLLELRGPSGPARVRLAGGLIADARTEGTVGVKALYRLLPWTEGNFTFSPGEPPSEEDARVAADAEAIGKPIDELLLEGLRQTDELPALRAALPSPSLRLRWTAEACALQGEQHPVTAEILELARGGAGVGEVIARSRATDCVAAQTLQTLLRKGLLETTAERTPEPRPKRPLVSPAEQRGLRSRWQRAESHGSNTVGKLLIAATEGPRLQAFIDRMAPIEECRLEEGWNASQDLSFGTIGQLELADDLALDLFVLPASEGAKPLWQPFAAHAIGAVLLLAGQADLGPGAPLDLAAFLARGRGLPVLFPGLATWPESLRELGPLAAPSPEGAEPTLRELLALASRASAPPEARAARRARQKNRSGP